ncbi:MAG TPA: hypothetical protein VE130_13595 [Nitrososphaeraceae archaeon]|nr:hypothetical protein [Nitrososphaeraceae archaeon]
MEKTKEQYQLINQSINQSISKPGGVTVLGITAILIAAVNL